ncbi:hypothetical protein NL108_014341 [Boleophthalmus pectinirostris]|nr:hypothetical protein NL108_014341 [Boleophthalmus pectinirostris]
MSPGKATTFILFCLALFYYKNVFLHVQMGRVQCPLLLVVGQDDQSWPSVIAAMDVSSPGVAWFTKKKKKKNEPLSWFGTCVYHTVSTVFSRSLVPVCDLFRFGAKEEVWRVGAARPV